LNLIAVVSFLGCRCCCCAAYRYRCILWRYLSGLMNCSRGLLVWMEFVDILWVKWCLYCWWFCCCYVCCARGWWNDWWSDAYVVDGSVAATCVVLVVGGMTILHHQKKGRMLNTIEQFHIYKAAKTGNHLNDHNTDTQKKSFHQPRAQHT
jgi:hypothetical protein